MRLRILTGTGCDPHENLAIEQILLESAGKEDCTLYLWQNRDTVVIGKNQNAWKECRIYGVELSKQEHAQRPEPEKALDLLRKAERNHQWRQKECINLIPSENTPSRAVQMLCASDPSCRYAEHKKVKSFYDKDIFYYQGISER